MFKSRRNGAWFDQASSPMRRFGAGWTYYQFVRRRQSGAWVEAWTAYTALTVSASNVQGAAPNKGSYLMGDSYAHTTGGAGALTFTCTRQSGADFAVTQVSQGVFRFSIANPFSSPLNESAIYRISVTDGRTSAYVDISVICGSG